MVSKIDIIKKINIITLLKKYYLEEQRKEEVKQ